MNSLKTRMAAILIAVSAAAVGLIANFEGFSPTVYKDAVNVNTIGYGHTGKDVKPGMTITRTQAKALLVKDADKHWEQARQYIKVPISQHEADAYASFVYNVGVGNFARSTLLKKLNQGRYSEACAELKKWVYAGGKRLKGLVRRREAEYRMCTGHDLKLSYAPANDWTYRLVA